MHDHGSRVFDASRADRLDDADRRAWLRPDVVAETLGIAPGARVADVGAGTGFFATAFAERVSPGGRVYAVDLQDEMLERLRRKLDARPLPVEPVLGRAEDTHLASDSVDLVFFGSVWHELDDAAMVLAEARRIMKVGGRLAILDWRADVAPPPGPPAWHRQPLAEVAKTLQRERWQVRTARPLGPYTYLVTADLR